MKQTTAVVLLIMTWLGAGFAQEATTSSSLEDDLFGSESDAEALVTPEQANTEAQKAGFSLTGDIKAASLTLENNKLRIGGSLNAELRLKYLWTAPYTKKNNAKEAFLNPDVAQLRPVIGANLFFDARPVQDVKLYGKFLFEFPFEKNLDGTLSVPKSLYLPNGVDIPISVNGSPNVKIWEMYTDFSVKDIAFFRFGKHTVKWGTGYFYSPADVINISRIDPQKPTKDREGPVSLRTHIVIPNTQHNIWLYLLPDTKEFKPQYTAGAVKAEFVFGDWEWGIGGWYRYEKAPRLISTLSGSIAGKVAVFAEGLFAWGSDYTYYKNDVGFTSYQIKDKPFFQATAGGSYSNERTHTSIAFQYYYNGFGYVNTEVAERIMDQATAAFTAQNYAHPAIGKYRDIAAMGNKGRHYLAFTVAQNKIGTDALAAKVFQQFAIGELEGITAVSINWKIYKFIEMQTGPSFSYPISPSAHTKGSIGYNLSFKLGGGKF